MKNLSLPLGRFAVVLAGALSLGACNRAPYTTLPSSTANLGSTPIARQQPAGNQAAASASAVVTAPAAPTPPPAPKAAEALPAAPVVAAAPAASAPVALAPVAQPAPTPKLNLVQRLALRKLTKKLDKLASQAPQFKKHDATAKTARIEGNLRSAILFGLISLIFFIIGGGFFNTLGAILFIIGIVFLVLWVLDQA